MIELFKLLHNKRKGDFMANKTNSMAHTKWMCKYHIVFTPKYRRKATYNQYKESIRHDKRINPYIPLIFVFFIFLRI